KPTMRRKRIRSGRCPCPGHWSSCCASSSPRTIRRSRSSRGSGRGTRSRRSTSSARSRFSCCGRGCARSAGMAATMTDSDEPFLSRWSRLKREAAADRKQKDPEAGQEDAAGVQPGAEAAEPGSPGPRDHEPESDDSSHQTAPDLEEIDFDKLDSTSDYKRFMDGNVPDEVRRKALSKLWLSDPVLGGPEQLSDYMEDFSDAAVAATGGV